MNTLKYPADWSDNARRWHWRERAHAWDVHQRELLALSERNTRLALHSRRVERMEDYLDAVCEVLDAANMTAADEQLAREWLPQMRVFLRDLLVAERQEFERGDYERNDPDSGLVITADDLRAAQRRRMRCARLSPTQAPRSSQARAMYGQVRPRLRPDGLFRGRRTLLVCVGPDSALMLDLAALRAVRSATGLKFSAFSTPRGPSLPRHCGASAASGGRSSCCTWRSMPRRRGWNSRDGVADGNWLSERLFGVRIMLLASCQGDSVGDWLGVVPHVITLSEEISHEDAAVLTQHFWHNIGLSMEPGPALDEALTHCPPAVSEYVVRHW